MWSILYCVRNDPERLRASQRRRGLDEAVVDEAVRLDREWRELKARVDRLRHELNRISSAIPKLKDDEKKKAVEEARRLSALVAEEEARLRRLEEERERVLLSIPNILHESVPEGRDESDNVPVRYWGRPRVWRGHLERFLEETKGFEVEYEVIDYRPVGHADAVEAMGWADVRRAAKVAGARFYYLYEDLVWLDFALMLYALDFLSRRGFRLVEPPFMMRRAALEGVISFDDFRDMIYYGRGAWRGTWSGEGGGVLINQGIHTLDLFLWIAQEKPKKLFSFTNNLLHDIEVEDVASASLLFENGAQAVLQFSCFDNPGKRYMNFRYENAIIEVDKVARVAYTPGLKDMVSGKVRCNTVTIEWEEIKPKTLAIKGHKGVLYDFADAILNDREPFITGEEGLKSLEIVNAIIMSAVLHLSLIHI